MATTTTGLTLIATTMATIGMVVVLE